MFSDINIELSVFKRGFSYFYSRSTSESLTEHSIGNSKQSVNVTDVFNWINKTIPRDVSVEMTATVTKRKSDTELQETPPKSSKMTGDAPTTTPVNEAQGSNVSKTLKRSLDSAAGDEEAVEGDTSSSKRARTEEDVSGDQGQDVEKEDSAGNAIVSDTTAAEVSAERSSR